MREENRNLPQPIKPDLVVPCYVFVISKNNFQGWLPVWRMDVSKGTANNKDLLEFARSTKSKFTDLVENEIKRLKSVKVTWVGSKLFNCKKR